MDAVILKAGAAGAKQFILDNKRLKEVPKAIGRLESLESLSMKTNNITRLPHDLALLRNLTSLNVGNNLLTCLDKSLAHLWRLEALHLYQNQLTDLDVEVLRSLLNLKLLNLNNNLLSSLPPDIKHLKCLTHLSLANNKISQLPDEIGELAHLVELNLEGNTIERLPYSLGMLHKLKKLFLQKNRLKRLPKTMNGCSSLSVLDVSCNKMEMFPLQLLQTPLSEFHFEGNRLIPFIPIPSELVQEVLTLKELAGRALLANLFQGQLRLVSPSVDRWLKEFSQSAGVCALCQGPFLDSWLDCIKFVDIKTALPNIKTPSQGGIPFYAPLCSYECFDATAHEREFYGLSSV